MASPAPLDAKTLTNWEEAFEHHSIPQVRTLHKQLQNDLGVNREKLKALVGESYRDLLRTAEKIIEMNDSMQKVESNLADASRNCNYRLMEKKARNVKLFQDGIVGRDREKYMFAAQIAVLQGCSKELSKLLHRNGSCLLAARVFVISRLVLKSLQEKGATAFSIVTTLRDQMTNLRALLLRHIDHILRVTDIPINTVIESMCALALVKTSSPADLLRHFLNMRSNAISTTLDPSGLNSEAIHNALKIFHNTLQYNEAIFPRKITEALQLLKIKPLFDNPELRNIPELNLDTNERFLPEDVRGFIPWVRHDELERSRVNDSVKTWANRELESLNGSIKQALKEIEDIGVVVGLRREILDSWNSNNSKLLHVVIGSEKPKRELREQLNMRLVELLDAKGGTLKWTGEKLGRFAMQPKETNADATKLWSDALLNMPLSDNAALFRKNVKAAIAGHDASVKSVIHEYRVWSKSITRSFQLVTGISKIEKRDEFDDDEFSLDSDDALDGAEDSEMLKKALCESLENAYKGLEKQLETLVRGSEENPNYTDTITRSAFLLRSIRYIRQNPPRSSTSDEIIRLGWFAKSLVTQLQNLVATGVSCQAVSLFRRALHRRKWERECPSVPLWEGTPRPLPVQPSPDVFKFLHELVTVMGQVGIDIWTPATVQQLRGVVRNEVWAIVGDEIDRRGVRESKEKVNAEDNSSGDEDVPAQAVVRDGEATPTPEESEQEPKQEAEVSTSGLVPSQSPPPQGLTITPSCAFQLLYDLTYLFNFALPKESTPSGEDKLSELKARIKIFEEGEFERINDSAKGYWRRTSLLFSLLA